MSDQPRSFPDRPSLRYLKLEARRRLSAGEFTTLHDAQLAIAREHGLSSWTALKEYILSLPDPEADLEPEPDPGLDPEGHAVAQVRWVVSRFRGAGQPAWSPPGEEELHEHFHENFLSRVPADRLVTMLTSRAGQLREDLVVTVDQPRFGLDDAANDHLHTLRLADDAVTVRELLTHTGGVDSPTTMFAERVLVSLTGPVMACGGERGTFAPSTGGYAALGQLIADVTGSPYPDAAARLVLDPLLMNSSWFPARRPGAEEGAVTGYHVADDGSLRPTPGQVSTVPAAAGLWATAADLARFGAGWSSLLPPELAHEALRPQAGRDNYPVRAGFGWMINSPSAWRGMPAPAAASPLRWSCTSAATGFRLP